MHIRVRIHTILVLLATALTTAAQNHANPNDTIIAAQDSTRTEERAEAAPRTAFRPPPSAAE